VDADQPLKRLFQVWTRSVLALLGERGAHVVSAGVIEMPASRRAVDLVIRLRRGSESYLRHVEFELRYRRGLELRLFEYAARLGAQFRLPVFTTVVFLGPPAPKRMSYREGIGGQVVHERLFDIVRLWELDPDELLAMGPGPAALVGRARDPAREHVQAAVELINRDTAQQERADLLYVLQALSAERYTAQELERMIPKEAAMASGMFAKEFRQARAEGLRLGCLDIVKYRHPTVLGRVTPMVQACASVATLRKWTLAAARLPAAAFVSLVTAAPSVKRAASQRRAPRPARRAPVRRG
jgi:hypothetical protein